MSHQKTIFQGKLDFGNQSSFQKAFRLFESRLETYYKNELALRLSDLFNDCTHRLEIPRSVVNTTSKTWKNTVDALHFLAQFSVSGKVEIYQTDSGTILKEEIIVPQNDKIAVQEYHRALLHMKGGEAERAQAHRAFGASIQAYNDHIQSREMLAGLYMEESNMEAALSLLQEAVRKDDTAYMAFFLRSQVHFESGAFEKAAADLEQAVRHSLAVQDIHWRARLEKARVLLELEDPEHALKELGFFLARKFAADSEHMGRRREAFFLAGLAYMDLGQFEAAHDHFDQAIKVRQGEAFLSEAACIYHRGLAKKKVGRVGFALDFETAEKMGFTVDARV